MHVRSSFVAVVVVVALAVAALGAPARARAQAEEESTRMPVTSPVKADIKGMVGLGLIGAELGFVLPAVAGLHETWAFIVFPIAGAAGGAVGGYFLLEKGDGHPELAVGALTAGMALFIPALIVTLSATAYEPEATLASVRAAGPGGAVRLGPGGLALAPPAIHVGSSDSPREALRTGTRVAQELRVSVLSGAF
jgi:hypothetical protein